MSEELIGEELVDVPEDKSRGAQEYAEAIAAIADVAAIAIELVPGMGKAKTVAKLVKSVNNAAPKLRIAAKAYDKVADSGVFQEMKTHAPDAAKSVFSKAASIQDKALDSLNGKINDKKNESAAAKARKEARRSVIGVAEPVLVSDFRKKYNASRSLLDCGGTGFFGQSGCYVFILLGKGPGKDFASYRQVYVGSALEDMGSAVIAELDGYGNPDVYADAKYGRNLYVLSYPCARDKVQLLKDSLITALDANVSYNAREV